MPADAVSMSLSVGVLRRHAPATGVQVEHRIRVEEVPESWPTNRGRSHPVAEVCAGIGI
jgi:hypothetical protein